MINKNSRLIIVITAIFAALPPFAIDTYSPAIPEIAHHFNILPAVTMMTFTTYFIGFSIGIMLWGPLSDVFGRKKILFVGVILYILSSVLCSLSTNYLQLELGRVGQGFSDAACITVAYAIIRDCFAGVSLTKAMATLGSIVMLAPIVAPSVGVFIMHITNKWQYIFHFFTAYGAFLFLICFIIPETMVENSRVTKIKSAFSYYGSHLANYRFIILVIAAAVSFAASFSFIGVSAVVYLKVYNTSKFDYALLFGMNGIIVMVANFILRQMTNKMSLQSIKSIVLIGAIVSITLGCTMVHIFPNSLLVFVFATGLFMFFNAMVVNILTSMGLHEVKSSFGAATSITNCLKFMCAGIANYVMSHFALANLNKSLFTQQFILIIVVGSILLIAKFIRTKTINAIG